MDDQGYLLIVEKRDGSTEHGYLAHVWPDKGATAYNCGAIRRTISVLVKASMKGIKKLEIVPITRELFIQQYGEAGTETVDLNG